MTFVEKLDALIKQRGITRNQMLLEANLGRNSFVNWSNRDSLPTGTAIVALAQYFNVSADYLLGLDTNSNPKNKTSSDNRRASTHDRAFDCIKYRVGREDAEFMFKVAKIPIEDNKYEIPTKVLKWIAAHCDVNEQYFNFPGEVEMCECDEMPYYVEQPENLEELLKDPDIEMLENKYLKAKYDKYAEIASKKLWESDNKLQQEIYQGFMELINQFDGDIGSQFALLDRARQAAKQLSEEVALRKERA